MDKLFYPKSLAIIGLSSSKNNIPRMILENLLRWGYHGRIFGINPKSNDMHVDGIRMFKKIDDLPEVPDLAICLIPAKFVPESVEMCGKFGIKRMAIPAGGFNELGDSGKNLSEHLLEIAKRYGIRFVGPNSLSVANTANGLCLPFVPIQKPPVGGMSLVSQSGGVGLMMWNFMLEENIGMAKFASIGNKLDLDEVDFLEYLGNDPDTKVICLYIEGITRGREMIEAAKKINKPIVVFKSNTTSAGQRIAMSHTAALSNNEDIIDAAFAEAGIIRIYNYSDFVAATKAFQLPPMKGNRIMVMSPAGGFSVMAADLCEESGFEFADPGADFYEGLNKFANAGVIKFTNPLDMGDIYDPQMMTHVIFSVMHNENVDGAIYVSQRPQMPRGTNIFAGMFQSDLSIETWGAILSSGKPLGICLFGQSTTMFQIKHLANFPVFNSPEEMVRAMAMQRSFYANKSKEPAALLRPGDIDRDKAGKWIAERNGEIGEESLSLVACYGLQITDSETAADADAALKIAEKMGFPVAMKVISPDALHKSDAGGVILNIRNSGAATKSFEEIKNNLYHYRKDADFKGVRIQKMAPDGIDMFIGGKYDRNFGPIVLYGFGGIYVEIFKDVAISICPATAEYVSQKLKKLKSYKILQGSRGKSAGDIDAYIDSIVRVSYMLADFSGIKELDINPLRILPGGSSVIALDARIKLES